MIYALCNELIHPRLDDFGMQLGEIMENFCLYFEKLLSVLWVNAYLRGYQNK